MQECLICHIKFEGIREEESLSKHLKSHINKEIGSKKEYYDNFFGNSEDGICHNENCNNSVRFKNIISGYIKFCSAKCNRSSSSTKSKQKKTMFDKYGIYHNFSGQHGSRKCDKTLKERYGVSTTFHSVEIREKIRHTNLIKYGKEHNWNGEFGSRSCDITRRSRMSDEELKLRMKNGMLEKYGVDNYFRLTDKIKEYWLEYYGVENPMQHPEIFEKSHSSQSRKSYRLKRYQTKFGNEVKYQSKLELSFINFCEEHDIEIFDGNCIWYNFNGKRHRYFIDFKIKIGSNYQLVELKGMHPWYYQHIESGLISIKNQAAIEYSSVNNYLPFIYFLDHGTDKNNFGLGSVDSNRVE